MPGSGGSSRNSLTVARFKDATRQLVDELVKPWRESCVSRDGSLLREAERIWSPWNFGTLVNELVGHDSLGNCSEDVVDPRIRLAGPTHLLRRRVRSCSRRKSAAQLRGPSTPAYHLDSS